MFPFSEHRRLGRMLRCLVLTAVGLTVVACQNCDNKCTGGITFLVGDVAGALARGSSEPLSVCFDNQCRDIAVSRANAGNSVFLPFDGVGKDVDHTLTVKGSGTLTGSYSGKLTTVVQKPGGGCKSCALATVKVGADGTLTPGVPGPSTSSTVATTTTSVG